MSEAVSRGARYLSAPNLFTGVLAASLTLVRLSGSYGKHTTTPIVGVLFLVAILWALPQQRRNAFASVSARTNRDYATFALLADVFVLESHRGLGLSKRLLDRVTSHPDLQGLRRWLLLTSDAHSLYARYGFEPLTASARFMEIARPDIYQGG